MSTPCHLQPNRACEYKDDRENLLKEIELAALKRNANNIKWVIGHSLAIIIALLVWGMGISNRLSTMERDIAYITKQLEKQP